MPKFAHNEQPNRLKVWNGKVILYHNKTELQIYSYKNIRKESSGNYHVRLQVNGKPKSFGTYADLELAELVASEARNLYYGEYANHG